MLDSLLAWLSQYRSVLSLIVAVFLPQLLPRIALLFRKDRRAPASHFSAPLPNTLKALLVIHSLYQAYRVLLPPYDVFTSNHIPLLVPQDVLRSVVLGSVASSTDLEVSTDAHPLVELLLQKLSRIEGRYLYSRYGHDTLLNCVWCSDSLDYLLYCLPRILGPYVLQAVLVGLMSLTLVGGVDAGRRALAWRAWVGWALVLGAVGEGTANYTWTIRAVQGQCTHVSHWAPAAHTRRSWADYHPACPKHTPPPHNMPITAPPRLCHTSPPSPWPLASFSHTCPV